MLQGVREVSLQGAPKAPARVSQRAFDATCESSPSLPELPPARSIARQLRLPWLDVLRIAHEPPQTHAHRLGRALTRPEQNWLTKEHIAYVLRLVARSLGTNSVSPGEYRREREAMVAVDRSRYLHGRRLRLPTDDQIRAAVGGEWDAALALADLSTRAPHTGVGISTVDLLERCYEAHHAQPSAEELRRFARANRVPFQPDRKRTWNECVAAWKEGRQSRGLDVPDGLPPRGQRPNYSRNVGAARPGERRRRDWSHAEDCVEVVMIYLADLGSRRSSKRGYQDWASRRADAPAPSAFDQHGGWGRIRARALDAPTSSD
jgi:hypothetical protein